MKVTGSTGSIESAEAVMAATVVPYSLAHEIFDKTTKNYLPSDFRLPDAGFPGAVCPGNGVSLWDTGVPPAGADRRSGPEARQMAKRAGRPRP